MKIRQSRWGGAVFATVWLTVTGLLAGEQIVVLSAIVPIGYLAYGYLTPLADPSFEIERTVSPANPLPGDEVTVELTLRNDSEEYHPDVRVADTIPEKLTVSGGSARGGFVCEPGAEVTVEYRVRARRGEHAFGDATVTVRSVGGRYVETVAIEVEGQSGIQCRESIPHVPLRAQTMQYVGQASSDIRGSGTEFFATREYRRGDPVRRINWRHYASRGELSTIEYREERAISVTLLVDATARTRTMATESAETGVELGCYVARAAVFALQDDGHSVGLAVVDDGGLRTQVAPGGGTTTREQILEALGTELPDSDAVAPSAGPRRETDAMSADGGVTKPLTLARAATAVDRLRNTIPADTQVICISPATDEWVEFAVERFESHGHLVSVLSPDVLGRSSMGRRISQVERRSILTSCRRSGARVYDWDPARSLGLALWGDDR